MSEKQDQIVLRTYEKNDEFQISHLFFNNFPDTLKPEDICQTWLWQFQNGFSKPSCVSVADLSGEIVAHYAVMWFPMCCQGKNIEGAISTATVTDVKARGKGLFTKLAQKVFKETESDGCKIIFGFPNSQSIKGFIKHLEWFEVAKFPLLIKPVNFTPFLNKFLNNKWVSGSLGFLFNVIFWFCFKLTGGWGKGNGIEIKEPHEGFTDDVTQIWKSSFASGKIAVSREHAFLRWRYLDKPFSDYHIMKAIDEEKRTVGVLVTTLAEKKGVNVVYVMEMMALNNDRRVYEKFLAYLDIFARKQGADALSMLCLPNHPCKCLFYQHGFIPVPRKMFPQDIHFCARANSPDMDKSVLQDADNWFITWGDLDIV